MDKKKRNLINLIVWGILSLFILLFIFSNSLRNGPESMEQSSWFVKTFQAIFDPNHNLDIDTATLIVRKAAHFSEFFALGFSIRMTCVYISRLINRDIWIIPFIFCFLMASTDEFIQSFTGRTSAFGDVMIDFSGSSLAILIITVVIIVHRIKTKKASSKEA